MPLDSSVFSVREIKFPADHGLIAPGMVCTFVVDFQPKALTPARAEVVIHVDGTRYDASVERRL